MSTEHADALLVYLGSLEETMLAHIQNFERKTGMRVHAIKVFPGDQVNGRRTCKQIEVVAQLK